MDFKLSNVAIRKFLTTIFIAIMAVFFWASSAEAGIIGRPPNNLGLVGYWSFNDATSTTRSTLVQDFSGNNNNGVMTNMANPATAVSGVANGRLGKALSFDGSNDYVNAGNSSGLTITGSLTLSMWVNIRSLGDNNLLIDKRPDTGFTGYFINLGGTGTIRCLQGLSTHDVSTVDTIPFNVWVHITCTDDLSNIRIYLNGKQSVSASVSGTPINSGNLFIGAQAAAGGFPVNGLIDEVRIYNRALSADEVKQLYNSR